MHIQIRPQALPRKFKVAEHGHSVGGRRCHDKMRLAEARGGSVVIGDAVFAQHQAIPDLSNRYFQERVAIDAVQELSSIAPLNVDFAQRGHVANAD